MDKNISIVRPGQGEEPIEATIKPGASAADVLAEAGLKGFVLSKTGSASTFLDAHENVFEAVENGQKLYALKDPKVGALVSAAR